MAQVKNNFSIEGISGKIGKQIVFRQVNGKTIIAARPHRNPTTHPTLISQNNRFRLASAYAKKALADPVLKEEYTAEAKKRGIINPYNMAVSDYMKKPEISQVNTSAYTGKRIKEPINIEVTDNFKVIAVKVTIICQSSIIEEGYATFSTNIWQYYTTTLNPYPADTKIVITASDRAQNQDTQIITELKINTSAN